MQNCLLLYFGTNVSLHFLHCFAGSMPFFLPILTPYRALFLSLISLLLSRWYCKKYPDSASSDAYFFFHSCRHLSEHILCLYERGRKTFLHMAHFLSNDTTIYSSVFYIKMPVLSFGSIVNNSGLGGCQSRTVYSTDFRIRLYFRLPYTKIHHPISW